MESEVALIRYQCKFCHKKREITANKELLLKEILTSGGNGLAKVIDQHTCNEGIKEFILLQVDANFSVRGQSKFTDLFEKSERKVMTGGNEGVVIPIPGGIGSMSRMVTEVNIPDYSFTSNNDEYYVYYYDKRTKHKLILNDDQKPERIKKVFSTEKEIEIEFDPKDRLLERWLFYLIAINEKEPPETINELLFQFLFIQEKRYLNKGPISQDIKILTSIGHMSSMRFAIKYGDQADLFQPALKEFLTGYKYAIGKEIFHILEKEPVALEYLLKQYLTRISFIDLLDILNEMKKYGLIEEIS